jgi:xanthine/CO dehydrogenase XdhC/CoxF family maturation factor
MSGNPQMVVYDMVAEDDVWGLSQGCNGVIYLLLEPIDSVKDSRLLRFIRRCFEEQKVGVIATVFRVEGEFKALVGTRVMMFEDGSVSENIRHPVLSAALLEDCERVLSVKHSIVKEYRFLEGIVEAFVELISPPLPLVIFGAGSNAMPVARFAKELGWNVTIVDHRPAALTKERFPNSDALVLARPEELAEKVTILPQTVVVVMTHNFSYDLQLLKSLLPSPIRYLGLLGPKKRTELLFQKMRENGFIPTKEQLDHFYNPIGVNIGAESPEEIALAVLAEIQAVLAKRDGGFLKDHRGPIHPNPS